MPGLPPNADCHVSYDSTATGGPFGSVSAGSNPRPSIGFTPSTVKSPADTAAVVHAPRPIGGGEVRLIGRERADRGERVRSLLQFQELRRRHPELVEPHFRELARDEDEPIGLGVAERPKDHGVHHREDGGVRPDAQRQGENRDEGKAGRAQQIADGMTNVAQECVHRPRLDAREARIVERPEETAETAKNAEKSDSRRSPRSRRFLLVLDDLGLDRDLHRAAVGVRHRALAFGQLRDLVELRGVGALEPVRGHLELRRLDLDPGVALVRGDRRAHAGPVRGHAFGPADACR